MNTQDLKEVKIKIIEFLKLKGPSLPVRIANEAKISLIFAGAFLSEMNEDRVIRISNMKVGGSPLYYLPGQESQLENFSNSLGKDKEAFILLKEKNMLKDEEQSPQTRVSLRSLKDFAMPFKSDNHLFWRFHSFSESQVKELFETLPKPKIEKKEEEKKIEIKPEIITPKPQVQEKTEEKALDIFNKDKEEVKELETEKKEPKPKKAKTAPTQFLEEVKLLLSQKSIEILNTEKYDKKEVIIKAKTDKEFLVFAFNKKKITDKEMIKAYKKALSQSLPYMIIIKDDLSKKMKEAIDASKLLLGIEKLTT